jgi:hypothetical protein
MSQKIHEEILDLIENSRGELKTQVMKLTNEKNERLGLKFSTVNKYYQELLKTYNPKDITIGSLNYNIDNCFKNVIIQYEYSSTDK